MGFFQEFKEFAVKGNAMDMAVGIILGTAFNKIVNSIVADIIMPPIGLVLGGTEFSRLRFILQEQVLDPTGTVATPEVAIRYGLFINNMIDFLIIAMSVFVVVKIMNRLIRQREKEAKTG